MGSGERNESESVSMPTTLYQNSTEKYEITVTESEDGSVTSSMTSKAASDPEPDPKPGEEKVFVLPERSDDIWASANVALRSGPVTLRLMENMGVGRAHERLDLSKKQTSEHRLTIKGPGLIRGINSQNRDHRQISNVTIEHLVVEHGMPDKLISISGSDWLIRNVTARHLDTATNGPGIYVVPTARAPEGSSQFASPGTNIEINGCDIGPTYGEAVYVGGGAQEGNGEPHRNIRIIDNNIQDPGIFGGQPDAIDVKVCSNVEIRDNHIEGMDGQDTGRAIVTQGVDGLRIVNNEIRSCRNCEDGWIAINDTWRVASRVEVLGNRIINSTGIKHGAITIYGALDPVRVSGNEFSLNDGPDVWLAPGVVRQGTSIGGNEIELAAPGDLERVASAASPGDTIWIPDGMILPEVALRGVEGTGSKPIRIAASSMFGAHIRSDGEPENPRQPGGVLHIEASCHDLVVEGLEISSTVADQDRVLTDHHYGDAPPGTASPLPVAAITNFGHNVRVSGCYLHDCLSGYGQFGQAPFGNRITHCLIMNNGGIDPIGNSGHGLYLQNNDPRFPTRVEGCLVLGNFDLALQFFGSSSSNLLGLELVDNAFYRNGVIIGGTGGPAENIRVEGNVFFDCSLRLGFTYGRQSVHGSNQNGEVANNLFRDGGGASIGPLVNVLYWNDLILRGNNIYRTRNSPGLRFFTRADDRDLSSVKLQTTGVGEPIVVVSQDQSASARLTREDFARRMNATNTNRPPDSAFPARAWSNHGWVTGVGATHGAAITDAADAWNVNFGGVRVSPNLAASLNPTDTEWYLATPFGAGIKWEGSR